MRILRLVTVGTSGITILWSTAIVLGGQPSLRDGTVFTVFVCASMVMSVVSIVAAAKRIRDEMAAIRADSSMVCKGLHEMEAESAAFEIALNAVSILVVLMWLNHWIG